MKKKLFSLILLLCMILMLFPNIDVKASAVEPVSDQVIQQRIDELYDLLGKKYFTVNGKGDGEKTSDHGCSNCQVNNVINAQWFRNMFGTVKKSQLFLNGGKSCMGFVEFAEWYIFRTNNSDTVLRSGYTFYDNGFNYNTLSKNAHIGDYIRAGGHSFIYISADSTGVNVLDCNWNGSYNCMVDIHKIQYSRYAGETISISKLYSKAAGKGASVSNSSVKTCTITFDPKGGSVSPATKTITAGATLTGLPTPTRSGYTFVGWGIDETGSTAIVTDGAFTFDQNTTLYARWRPQSTYFTITFDANGGTVSQSSKTIASGETYGTLPTPSRDFYQFDGWYTSANGGSLVKSSTAVSGNQTLYAHWTFIEPEEHDIKNNQTYFVILGH